VSVWKRKKAEEVLWLRLPMIEVVRRVGHALSGVEIWGGSCTDVEFRGAASLQFLQGCDVCNGPL
jgi:hypothetical protein